MCGRFTMTYPDAHLLAEELGVPVESLADYAPHYNIAPTQPHFVLRIKNEVRELLPAKWGLINTWAKDAKRAAAQINARSESLSRSGAFREAFQKRRCIVPADGFYEWNRSTAIHQPYLFRRTDGKPLLFAGLQESWRPHPGEWERTFTIVTTGPSADVAFIHDRMPVILDEEEAALWMFSTTSPERALSLLIPAAAGTLAHAPVSTRVNRAGNDDPSLVVPVELAARLL